MTIHRALSELKVIDSRIEKVINNIQPVTSIQRGRLNHSKLEKEEFDKKAASDFQSVNDLIERKNKIKSAIVDANGKTNVVVNGETMTIADAINRKQSIVFKKQLINALKTREREVSAFVEENNATVEQNALRIAEAALQKDNVKIGDNDAVAITEPYIEKNKFEYIDPLKVSELIDTLEDEVSNFLGEVDAVLSEANAVTKVEV